MIRHPIKSDTSSRLSPLEKGTDGDGKSANPDKMGGVYIDAATYQGIDAHVLRKYPVVEVQNINESCGYFRECPQSSDRCQDKDYRNQCRKLDDYHWGADHQDRR